MGSTIDKKNTIDIRVSDDDGFSSSSYNITIPIDIYANRYINDYGSEFIKWDGDLYVMIPRMFVFSFEKVRSKEQIEKAFNPDRYMFKRWERD